MPANAPYNFGSKVLSNVPGWGATDQDALSSMMQYALGEGFTGMRGNRINLPDLRRLYDFLPDQFNFGDTSHQKSYLGDILGGAKEWKAGQKAAGGDGGGGGGGGGGAGTGWTAGVNPETIDTGIPPAPQPILGPAPNAPSPTISNEMVTRRMDPNDPRFPGNAPGSNTGGGGGAGGTSNATGFQFGQKLLPQLDVDYDALSAMLESALGGGFEGLMGGRVNMPDLRRLYNWLPAGDDQSYLGDIIGQARALRGGNGTGDGGGGGETPPPPPSTPPSAPAAPSSPVAQSGGSELPNPLDVFSNLTGFYDDLIRTNVWDAVSEAGYGGNRYSSSSQRAAAEAGARGGLEQQAQLSNLLYNTFLANQSFALQAAGLAPQLALAGNTLDLSKLGALGNFAQFEQGRGDDIASMLFNSFQNNQYGLLPLLLQGAFSGSQTPNIFGFPSATNPSGFEQGIRPTPPVLRSLPGARLDG
jgi:hypothetical protein